MKKEIADLWVKALRSGQYEQGMGTLDRPTPSGKHAYCCLGVLCLIAPRDLIHFDDHPEESKVKELIFGGNLEEQKAVMEWAGIKDPNGRLDGTPVNMARDIENEEWFDTSVRSLAELNDGEKGPAWDFQQIADLIEGRWRDL